MSRKPTLAVVGATGAVGAVMLEILSQHADVWGEIRLVSSPRSAGRKLAVRGEQTEVLALGEDVLDGVDVALFLVPDEVSARWAPIAAAKGAVVVDSSAAFRMDPEVPLVVPEVNPHAIRVRPRGIVASPHCTTLAMIPAVGALHAEFGLSELILSSYQAASGAGRDAAAVLRAQLSLVAGTELGTGPGDVRRAVGDELGPFPAPLALNVVPWTGTLQDDGWSSEELALRAETRKILGLPGLRVAATCVRVPVITTDSLAVHARFESEVSVERAHEILATSPAVVLYDDPAAGDFPTPADVVGTDPTWVGRVRRAPDDPCALELFVCGDNLRKGGALNSAQIAEALAAEIGPRLGPRLDPGLGLSPASS
ncbi:aspartate-semialdehyde dehydrogenase [Streptomyces sp. NPDC052236]|uniref:aspartate-semialdehyde dehydrogenase n=1 Tax=Streptomyces sp. NPDC052236 TaxID=3365686 RepID=UPI0037D824FC